MSARQAEFGKAFEYAMLKVIYENLKNSQNVMIEENTAYFSAKSFYDSVDKRNQEYMFKAANAAIRTILRLEPQLENHFENTPLYLLIQKDSAGQLGDVRDILTIRKQNDWMIGLSCKHNHSAVKHSRLSQTIDFGKEWLGIPCSKNYFNEINPLFEQLRELKAKNMKWNELKDKEERFYYPLLIAFKRELIRLAENNSMVPELILCYLLGRHDFYKVITNDKNKTTTIQVYNIYGTLNKNAEKISSQVKVKKLQMPSRFYEIDFKANSKNTILVQCDRGWLLNMRIHNASTYVEPSLKFDIKLNGVPAELYTHHEPW